MDKATSDTTCDISIILPVYNAALWLDDCLRSIAEQDINQLRVELCIFNDGSTDTSLDVIQKWINVLKDNNIDVKIFGHSKSPRGVGYARNKIIQQSCGRYLCFQDSDDIMKQDRLKSQYKTGLKHPTAIIGCQFERDPPESTFRFTQWANLLSPTQLNVQIYTSHGPTVIMPTWFCSRNVFERIGGFDEGGKGVPEDLIFFYKHLDLGGEIVRVDEILLVYRYHPFQTTFSVDEKTIWNLRIERLQKEVLPKWNTGFTIWNAGKQGRRLFRSLQPAYQSKVNGFCDVDLKKINIGFYTYQESKSQPKPRIPIVHFTKAIPPFIICVKLDMTEGIFEANLKSLHLTEGEHYILFS